MQFTNFRTTKGGHSHDDIRNMAQTMEDEDIIVLTGLAPDEAARITRQHRGSGWLLTNQKNGKHYYSATERGCYRKAMILGLVDYTMERAQ